VTKVPEATENQTVNSPPATACGHVPDFTRLRYFHGRALGALDLRREQAYFLDKDRLRNRILHGWGIVCGLDVDLVAPAPCDPTDQSPATTTLAVSPGAALDPGGNEIVVRNPRHVIIEKLLSAADHSALAATPDTVYLTLGYHEQPIDPTRPLLSAECEAVPACEYGRVCETYRICASTTAPDPGPACEPCCGGAAGHGGEPHSQEMRNREPRSGEARGGEPCCEACEHGGGLLLATVNDFQPGVAVTADQLDLDGRRGLAIHNLARITEVSWVHGATYTREDATRMLQELEVHLSRPVQIASLHAHVIDLTLIEGGGGRSAGMFAIEGAFVDPRPDTEQTLTSSFTFASTSDESLQFGDRVVITIRGDFILDECCRALDANHVGGGVPTISNPDRPQPVAVPDTPHCPSRASGNGNAGGEFVSWFHVQERNDR
jgi:hypothetical protein